MAYDSAHFHCCAANWDSDLKLEANAQLPIFMEQTSDPTFADIECAASGAALGICLGKNSCDWCIEQVTCMSALARGGFDVIRSRGSSPRCHARRSLELIVHEVAQSAHTVTSGLRKSF
jgi:hypothetical protein